MLEIDLLGCGDSSGDFADASWERWVDEVKVACDWLRQRREGEFWLWGLRTGGLLAAAVADSLSFPVNLLLWQPVISGKHIFNFPEVFTALSAVGGVIEIDNQSEQLTATIDSLLSKPEQARQYGEAGYQVLMENKGALDRLMLLLQPYLELQEK